MSGTPAEQQERQQQQDQERDQPTEPRGPAAEARKLFAELLGTFALTTIAAGGDVVAAVSHGEVGEAARAIAPGMVVAAFVYAVGDVSGAHFNPAVSLAFALRGSFRWARLPGYWAAQLAGALLAAALLRAMFGVAGHVGATRPHHGVAQALGMEVVLTLFLVTVILNTSTRHRLLGPGAALPVGATIALCGLVGLPVSGASMNPARSLGPALAGGELRQAWVYLLGPAAGALLAVVATRVLHGPQRREELEAAQGEGG